MLLCKVRGKRVFCVCALIGIGGLTVGLPACSKEPGQTRGRSDAPKAANGKGSEEADLKVFEAWSRGFVAQPHADVLLPDARSWFAAHFETGMADTLAAEYLESAKGLEGLPQAIEQAKSDGQTELRVSGFSAPIDMRANGLQNAALQRMTKPVTLFKLEMLKPGSDAGWSLWSFVYVDGTFRFVGKMTSFNPTRGDMVTEILCQMPLGKTEQVLQQKGVLDTTAVEFLTAKGVLSRQPVGQSGGQSVSGQSRPRYYSAAVDRKDPGAVAEAFLAAFKKKDLGASAQLCNAASEEIFAQIARDGEKHPRYKSLFSGWRWKSVLAWSGGIGEVRYRTVGNKQEAIVSYGHKGDEVFVVVLQNEDGDWAVEDLNSPYQASFNKLDKEPGMPRSHHPTAEEDGSP